MKEDKLDTADIEIALAKHFGIRRNLIVPNVSWGLLNHEADLLILSASGYATEIEIKVSKSDLLADKNKNHIHASRKIKRLYFAIPEHIEADFALKNILSGAGLFVVKKDKLFETVISLVREAEINKSAIKFTIEDRAQLARLGALRIWGMKKTIKNLRQEIHRLKKLDYKEETKDEM